LKIHFFDPIFGLCHFGFPFQLVIIGYGTRVFFDYTPPFSCICILLS
jgi:hypothetical protein